jgi:cyclophilin family peptidyl-prolyl cis-trans isomerase
MQTDLGGMDMALFDIDTPATVANFMNYVNRGDYDGTFIHRSVPGFVLQMGGYVFTPDEGDFFGSGSVRIETDDPVVNEPGISNVRGTIAMAKLAGDPDSATSEFFFNLADNSENLDNQNGGFTVFGEVTGNGMKTIDRIAGETRCGDYFAFNLGQCNGIISFTDAPLPYMNTNGIALLNPVSPTNTVQIINVGEDADGDGISTGLKITVRTAVMPTTMDCSIAARTMWRHSSPRQVTISIWRHRPAWPSMPWR